MLGGSAKGLFVIIENMAITLSKHENASTLCKLKVEMNLLRPKFGRRTTLQLTVVRV